MTKHIYILLINIFLFINYTYAQERSILYFDADWEETTKENASYYRNLPLEEKKNLVLIKDYYINGSLQMIGWANKNAEQYLEGEIIWYDENGKKSTVSNYSVGILNGSVIEYYENGIIKRITNYINGSKEGESKGFNEQGKQLYQHTYRNDEPYDGTFYNNKIRLNFASLYKNGKKDGQEQVFLNDSIVADGIYENGNAKEGSFFIKEKFNNNTYRKRLTLKNGKEDGKQIYYNYGGLEKQNTIAYYHAKNGIIDGEKVMYGDDDEELYKIIYKDGKPYEGTLLDNDEKTLVYKEGKIIGSRVNNNIEYNKYWEYYDTNNKKIAEEHAAFFIKGENYILNEAPLRGEYKDGKPYQGYFLQPLRELYVLDYYEKGKKKYQYSESPKTDTEDDYEPTTIIKSIYKRDKIYTGLVYESNGKNYYAIKTLEKGKTKTISYTVFAMHYGNQINIKETNTGYIITEANYPDMRIVADNGVVSLRYKEKEISRKSKNILSNKTITYGQVNESLVTRSYSYLGETLENKFREEYKSDFLTEIYRTLSVKDSKAKHVFLKFGNLLKDEDKDESKNKGTIYVARIMYDALGKPYNGMTIEKKGKTYTGKVYKEGKQISVKKRTTLKELNTFFEAAFHQ